MSDTTGFPPAVWFITLLAGVAFVCQLTLGRRYRRLCAISKAAARGEPSGKDTSRDVEAILLGIRESARRLGGSFHPETAAESVAASENQLVRAALVRWTVGSVLIIGLAGTFSAFVQLVSGSGLVEALGTLQSTPQTGSVSPELSESYAALSTAFLRVYESLGFAFLSSLAGLFGTIMLGFVGSIFVQPLKTRALLAVQAYAECVYQITAPPNQTEELAKSLTMTANALKTSSRAIDALGQTSELLNSAASRFEQAEAATVQLAFTLTSLATELQTSHDRWDLLVESLRESKMHHGEILEAFKADTTAQRQQSSSVVASAVSEMRDLSARMGEEIKKVSAAKMDQFIQIQEELRAVLHDTRKDWERAGTEVIERTGNAFSSSLGAVQNVIVQSRHDAALAQAEMAKLTQQVLGVVTTHQAALDGHVHAMTASLQTWSNAPAAVEQTITSLTGAITKLTPALERVSAMPERWETRVLGSIRQLDEQLQQTQENSRGMAKNLGRAAVQRVRDWITRTLRSASSTE